MRSWKTRCKYRTFREAYEVFKYLEEIEKKLYREINHSKK